MAGLEDRILKKNIPGKYSWWDDNSDADRSSESSCHLSDSDTGEDSTGEQVAQRNNVELQPSQKGQRKFNTGIKGILNDYYDSQEQDRSCKKVELRERTDHLNHLAYGAVLKLGEVSISAASNIERKRSEKLNNAESDDECSDDEFLSQYREKRLLQLQNNSNWPEFGEISEVEPIQFVEVVDSMDARVMVVVHLYESNIKQCNILNKYLEVLARKMSFSCFLRLRAFSAKKSIDPICLPALIIYKAGEVKHNFTRVTEHLPEKFTVDDVQEMLESSGVVSP